jgi:hypothetical protein
MSTYAHEVWLNNTCSYVNDMTCWNYLHINEFWPKGNNDMMQCATHNKCFVFAQKQEKEKDFQMFLKCQTLFDSYMKWRHERTQWS